MPQGMRLSHLVLALAACLVSASFFSCSQQDLSDYHKPSRDRSESTKSETETAASEVASEEPRPIVKPSDEQTTFDNARPSAAAETTRLTADEFGAVSALLPVNVVDGSNVRGLINGVNEANSAAGSSEEKQVVPAAASTTKKDAPAEPHKIELLVKEKTFQTESRTGALRVSFDDLDLLKVLNMEPVVDNAVELMPDWLRGLNGKQVRLRGFMYPTFDTEGIEQFVLARDNQICCFGRNPKVYDLVQINMKAGKSTYYIPATRAFDVIGKFKIEMQSNDGQPYGLYMIDNAEVIDK